MTTRRSGRRSRSDSLQVVVDNRETGLPEPVEISQAELRQAIINNPDILVGTLRDIIGGRTGGGIGGRPRQPSPLETPITDLLPPDAAEQLSDNVRRLTKADLLALGGWDGKATVTDLGLTFDDVQTVRELFAQQLGVQGGRVGGVVNPAAMDIYCCCCPCCCAAAVKEPLVPLE